MLVLKLKDKTTFGGSKVLVTLMSPKTMRAALVKLLLRDVSAHRNTFPSASRLTRPAFKKRVVFRFRRKLDRNWMAKASWIQLLVWMFYRWIYDTHLRTKNMWRTKYSLRIRVVECQTCQWVMVMARRCEFCPLTGLTISHHSWLLFYVVLFAFFPKRCSSKIPVDKLFDLLVVTDLNQTKNVKKDPTLTTLTNINQSEEKSKLQPQRRSRN